MTVMGRHPRRPYKMSDAEVTISAAVRDVDTFTAKDITRLTGLDGPERDTAIKSLHHHEVIKIVSVDGKGVKTWTKGEYYRG